MSNDDKILFAGTIIFALLGVTLLTAVHFTYPPQTWAAAVFEATSVSRRR